MKLAIDQCGTGAGNHRSTASARPRDARRVDQNFPRPVYRERPGKKQAFPCRLLYPNSTSVSGSYSVSNISVFPSNTPGGRARGAELQEARDQDRGIPAAGNGFDQAVRGAVEEGRMREIGALPEARTGTGWADSMFRREKPVSKPRKSVERYIRSIGRHYLNAAIVSAAARTCQPGDPIINRNSVYLDEAQITSCAAPRRWASFRTTK